MASHRRVFQLTNYYGKDQPHGYYEAKHTPGLWKHTTNPVQFTLVVDDFGVKYVEKKYADPLLNALQETAQTGMVPFTVASPWNGTTPSIVQTFSCLDTSGNNSYATNILPQKKPNILLWHPPHDNMAAMHNARMHRTLRPCFQRKEKHAYNKLSEVFYFMVEPSMAPPSMY